MSNGFVFKHFKGRHLNKNNIKARAEDGKERRRKQRKLYKGDFNYSQVL